MSENLKQTADTWVRFWDERRMEEVETNPMALEIADDFLKWAHQSGAKNALESGSGTGIVCALIAAHGLRVTLLDISTSAIGISKRTLQQFNVDGTFILSDLFASPFRSNSFDIVWNAGVLEHFDEPDQVNALREMGRVAKPGGLVITYTPYSRAVFYRIGKWWAERTGQWKVGRETPVRSLAGQGKRAVLETVAEYPICVKEQLDRFMSTYVVRGSGKIIRYATAWIPERAWKRIFGGYLLVSVFRKGDV